MQACGPIAPAPPIHAKIYNTALVIGEYVCDANALVFGVNGNWVLGEGFKEEALLHLGIGIGVSYYVLQGGLSGELNAKRGFLNCGEERGIGGKMFCLEECLICFISKGF